jgi:hypothetical protein
MHGSGSSRRDFLLGAAALGSAASLLPAASAPRRARSPNDRLRIGVVGCGGKGLSDMQACAKTQDIVALCDVDEGKAKTAREEQPKAAFYEDWRDMVEKEKLDGLVVSTPDHSHAGPALLAMSRGIHVFVQKPLTHTVHEARLLRDAARKTKVITSMGNQGTCLEGFRSAAECVRSGVIGAVTEVHVWTNRPVWPQGIARPNAHRSDPVFVPLGPLARCSEVAAVREPARRTASSRATRRSTGAASGTLAPARSATWPATLPTCRSSRSNSAPPTGSKR